MTPYDLSVKGVSLSPTQDTFQLDDITYVKGQAFPKSLEELAVKMCESYRRDGYRCFLIDNNLMLTIWRSPEIVPVSATPKMSEPAVSAPPPTNSNTASKIKRTYRGVVY